MERCFQNGFPWTDTAKNKAKQSAAMSDALFSLPNLGHTTQSEPGNVPDPVHVNDVRNFKRSSETPDERPPLQAAAEP